ncbi:hypothetical protein [Clostridium beijerinckii]
MIILVKRRKSFYWYKEVISTNGNVTFVKRVRSANALFPIVVTVLGIVTLTVLEEAKAKDPIPVTGMKSLLMHQLIILLILIFSCYSSCIPGKFKETPFLIKRVFL